MAILGRRRAFCQSKAIGDDWVEKWREAPIWRFSLPGGACGPDAVLGVLIPSVDRAGRYYPLTIAAVFVGRLPAASDQGWLEAAEECGLDALVHLQDPETLIHSLGALPCPREENREAPAWWTTGSRLVAPTHLPLPGLPRTADFAAMLDSAY